MITQIPTQTIAIGFTHLYLRPSVQGPATNPSPSRHRRYTGIT